MGELTDLDEASASEQRNNAKDRRCGNDRDHDRPRQPDTLEPNTLEFHSNGQNPPWKNESNWFKAVANKYCIQAMIIGTTMRNLLPEKSGSAVSTSQREQS